MYRFLLSRQWVVLTLIALILIPSMIWLGFWQLHRHEQRVARNDLIGASLSAPVVPVDELTAVGGEPADGDRYRRVTAEGTYDTDHQVVVRNRSSNDESIGYWVLTPLLRDDGTAVLVNRGWISSGDDPTAVPDVPAPPDGEVTVTGRLMPDETTGNTGIRERSGLPDGMVMMINSEERSAAMDGVPTLGGYLALTETSPAPADAAAQPELLKDPDHTSIGSHLAYAIQWWLFTAGVPVGWVILFRREIADQRAAAGKAAKKAAGAAGTPDAGPVAGKSTAGAGVTP
ncbi:SURF1 family protein [Streptomyces sp. RFCAC02]|uniref:SURF1 family cytochrome oxidase biogenesis protein n=1 Tax=Streptomyces sp. RFCAC02 TaxID=2499143 RepID=UPI001020214C|nr:SURF1 family protein [Streptomyces sp. RFCAC02]